METLNSVQRSGEIPFDTKHPYFPLVLRVTFEIISLSFSCLMLPIKLLSTISFDHDESRKDNQMKMKI